MKRNWSLSERNGLKCKPGNKAVTLSLAHLAEIAQSLLFVKALISMELPSVSKVTGQTGMFYDAIGIVTCLSDSG